MAKASTSGSLAMVTSHGKVVDRAPCWRLVEVRYGLVLITGPTGSGKSTTLAAVIALINESKRYHIITIENPIEFVYRNKNCRIHQGEIGAHGTSFAEALKAAGREDLDLVLVGEMRDLETVSMALTAAGHRRPHLFV